MPERLRNPRQENLLGVDAPVVAVHLVVCRPCSGDQFHMRGPEYGWGVCVCLCVW